jgi:hypothetical protein
VVVDDSVGVVGRLEQPMQEKVDSHRDPWLEAYAPATANQFASNVRILITAPK